MPTHCEKCRSCLEKSCALRYNKAIKNKGGFEMDDNNVMNEDKVGPIQRYYHEDSMARMERANKRWFVAWLVTFIILMWCIVWFFWRESQFVDEETTTETYTSETDGGGTAIVNRDGSVIYGEGNIYPDNQADTNP